MFRFFDEVEKEIEETFEGLLFGHSMWDSSTGRLEPLTQVTETLDKIIVTMDLPMVRKQDIHLTIEEDHVKVEASLQRCVKYERWRIQGQFEFKSFYKILRLPARVNHEEAKAKFKSGVLSIEIPKSVKGHKITVE